MEKTIKYHDSKEMLPGIYICDPGKNTECSKTACQDLCFHTTKRKYAKKEALEEAERIKENGKRII
ncbi:MAG: hypothetical protein IK115_07795 [Lachnospiraceae bacterium]|nr:hypothetical protein [Lachnospiraceae bacterium]